MHLALHAGAAGSANWLARAASRLVKARLCSRWCHGGIVIDGDLFHVTPDGMVRVGAGQWEPAKWELFEFAGDAEAAMWRYRHLRRVRYDWWSLLSFIGVRVNDAHRLYCFEWCWLVIAKKWPTSRVTPERLLREILQGES